MYGVGVVLYEMLAGRPPFEGRSAVELALHHVNDPPPPLPDGTPRAITEVVDRALAKHPGERFADGAEMAQALARAAVADPVTVAAADPVTVAASTGPRSGRGRAAPEQPARARGANGTPSPGARRADPTRIGEPMSPAAQRQSVRAPSAAGTVHGGVCCSR